MNRRASGIMIFLTFLSMLLMWGTLSRVQAQSEQRCFSETGFCIEGRIRLFWERNGGLQVFGFPTTPQQAELIEGRMLQTQWFERNRLELHPENVPPYEVLGGRIGVDRLVQQDRDWHTFTKSSQQSGCRYFEETGHNICGDFLAMWSKHGVALDGRIGTSEAASLALFGLPLSDAQTETFGDGNPYTVQWFERARFEIHPENGSSSHVLLGLLGNEIHTSYQPTPTIILTSTPTPTSIPTSTVEPTRKPRPHPTSRPKPTTVPNPTSRPNPTTLPPYPVYPIPQHD